MENIRFEEHSKLPRSMLGASLILHALVVVSFTVRAFLFPEDAINYESAIRVDLVALPDKHQKITPPTPETKAPPAPPPSKPAEKVPEKPQEKAVDRPKIDLSKNKVKDRKKAEKEALEKIRAMEALQSIEKEVAENEEKERQRRNQIKGNQLSQGNALKGIIGNQLNAYIGSLEVHVKNNWHLPQWLADLKLRASALVYIDEKGLIVRRMISKSSGNQTYDNLVLTAIDSSSPFPTPPAALVDLVKYKGFRLDFPD